MFKNHFRVFPFYSPFWLFCSVLKPFPTSELFAQTSQKDTSSLQTVSNIHICTFSMANTSSHFLGARVELGACKRAQTEV